MQKGSMLNTYTVYSLVGMLTRSIYVHSVLLFWNFYRTYQSTRRHIRENLHLQPRQCDNLKSRLGLALYLKFRSQNTYELSPND